MVVLVLCDIYHKYGNVDITQDNPDDQSEDGAESEQNADKGRNEKEENENKQENVISEGNTDGQGTFMGNVGGNKSQVRLNIPSFTS